MKNKLSKIINRHLEKSQVDQQRNYIGASSIGKACKRAIWYDYNHFNKASFTGKQLLKFKFGNFAEETLFQFLEQSGYTIVGRNVPCEEPSLPIFQGHIDGIIEHPDDGLSIVEMKSINDAGFRMFASKGLKQWENTFGAQKFQQSYYAQVQSYMGMKNINRAYLLAVNKDTSELCDEEIFFDEIYYDSLVAKAEEIVSAQEAPERINKNDFWFQCQECRFKGVCHDQ